MKYFIYIFILLGLISCNSDDDICETGEATPRLKVMFKKDNKITQLAYLSVGVDYGDGVKTISTSQNIDSLLIPLRVDSNTFTDIYFKTSDTAKAQSKIRLNYTTESLYVSPACGFKKYYKNLNPVVETPNPVTSVELIQNEITNETNAHLYLVF
ncbi:MAG: DUF6452 family protein [Bergeyella zoohelcum]|nr:DUF6452 family protein [Bergeyella zoohelcum]